LAIRQRYSKTSNRRTGIPFRARHLARIVNDMQLTKRAVGTLRRQAEPLDTDTVNRYVVEPLDHEVSLIGFFGGSTDEHWEITGRKNRYKTPDEALAVLQKEADAR
jgi:hypothetical protein